MERKLWKILYQFAKSLTPQWGGWLYSDADIVGVYLWAVVQDRPMAWAVDKVNWPDDLQRPSLPSQSTLSRRVRSSKVMQLMIDIENALMSLAGAAKWLIHVIDGKSLTVSGVTKDKDAAYGRAAGGMAMGYKLHAIWNGGPLPVVWGLAPMNRSEKTMARLLIPELTGGGYLLADAEFDANPLYDLAHEHGYQLLAQKRRSKVGMGHRKQSPYRLRSIELQKRVFGQTLYTFRKQIERYFGNLVSFGGGLTCLPAWVRRFPRVRNWVHGKLLVNAARWFQNHPDLLSVA